MSDRTPVVLVVDDEPELADIFGTWVDEEYETRVAHGGEEAFDLLDERVDVALLDRCMPELSGDDVLAAISERDLDCRVAMVTAVEPDFDVIEMGFDDYLTKPVSRGELLDLVESLVVRRQYDATMNELLSLVSKQAALQTEKTAEELAGSDAYQDLVDRIRAVRADADGLVNELSVSQTDVLFRQVDDTATSEMDG